MNFVHIEVVDKHSCNINAFPIGIGVTTSFLLVCSCLFSSRQKAEIKTSLIEHLEQSLLVASASTGTALWNERAMAKSIPLTGNSDMTLIAMGKAATLLLRSTESLTPIKFYSSGIFLSYSWKILHLLTLCQLINWVLATLWVKSWSCQAEGELHQWLNSKFMIEFPYFFFIYSSRCDWISG